MKRSWIHPKRTKAERRRALGLARVQRYSTPAHASRRILADA